MVSNAENVRTKIVSCLSLLKCHTEALEDTFAVTPIRSVSYEVLYTIDGYYQESDAVSYTHSKSRMVNCRLFDTGTYNVLSSAVGSSSYRGLPVPKHWNPVDRPHVALVESSGERVFCFLVSQPSEDNEEIWVKDLDSIQDDAVVEVKHSNSDYRYYRRYGQNWMMVAEKRDQFFVDVYQRGNYPLTVPTLDDNWSAFD